MFNRGDLLAQDLEGDLPVVAEIASEENDCHTPAADLSFDGIAVRQGGLEAGEELHGEAETLSREDELQYDLVD